MATLKTSMDSSKVLVLSTFTKFPLLAKEIQLEIWYHALPEGQFVYRNARFLYPPPKPHALYYASVDSRGVYLKNYKNINIHDTTCRCYAREKEAPLFFNSMKDTIVNTIEQRSHNNHCLLGSFSICCHAKQRTSVEFHHVAVIADQLCYRSWSADYRIDALVHDFNASKRISIYESFLNNHPAIETLRFVVGCETVRQTAALFPEMSLVEALRGSGRTDQAGLKYLKENFIEPTVEHIRDGFAEWKSRYPDVKIPRIQIVFPTSIAKTT